MHDPNVAALYAYHRRQSKAERAFERAEAKLEDGLLIDDVLDTLRDDDDAGAALVAVLRRIARLAAKRFEERHPKPADRDDALGWRVQRNRAEWLAVEEHLECWDDWEQFREMILGWAAKEDE